MKSRLDLIEGIIKSLFEGDLSIFPWMDESAVLIHKLVESIQECLIDFKSTSIELPISFSVYMNNEDRINFERIEWKAVSSKVIGEVADELGFHIERNPEIIKLITRNSLKKGEVQVVALAPNSADGRTSAVPVWNESKQNEKPISRSGPSLLLADESLFALRQPVTNIGRNSSNHLVINDLRVSRTHAQIRAVSEGFFIFDIGSSGGTYINGERISQRKLYPGDVISLAGVKLIYTEEQTSFDEDSHNILSETKPLNSKGNESC